MRVEGVPRTHGSDRRSRTGPSRRSRSEPLGSMWWSLSGPESTMTLSDKKQQERVERNGPLPGTPGSVWRRSRKPAGEQPMPSRRTGPEPKELRSWSFSDKTPAVQKNNSNNGINFRQFCQTCFENRNILHICF